MKGSRGYAVIGDIALIPGRVEMYRNNRTHIIGTVIVSPNNMSLDEVQKALGVMLKPVHYAWDTCLTTADATAVYQSSTGDLVFFEAHDSGISVHANDYNRRFGLGEVTEIVYQSVPTGPKTSQCAARQTGIKKKSAR
jgi:hypothetical protein